MPVIDPDNEMEGVRWMSILGIITFNIEQHTVSVAIVSLLQIT